jgi:hypothetical protein
VVSYFKEVTYEKVEEYVESQPPPPMFGKAVKAGIVLLFGGVISCIIGFFLVGSTVISLFTLFSSEVLLYAPVTLLAGILLFTGGVLLIVISIIIFIIKGLQWVIKN